ncbi:hypothetical protein [Conyzicola sp.]|uniref:hypothetical protein n=1 Tax=Conyzicola sp. TaxID=1969404 RepID=UPI003988A855
MTAPGTLLLTFEFEVPAGWHKLPVDATSTAAAVAEIAERLTDPGETRDQLARALAAVSAQAQAARRHGRPHWAYVPDPATGRVEALLSVGDIPGDAGSYGRYLELARVDLDTPESPVAGNPAELINRTTTESRLALGKVVSIHDFVIQPTAGGIGDPAVERAIVALFPDRAARAVECSIVTQNMAQFENVTQYLVDIVSTFRETRVKAS